MLVVKTAQPLGSLAAYLLEPRSEDGLTTWGVLGDSLAANSNFPVMRLPKSYPLTLGDAPTLPENLVVNQPITEAMLIGRGGFTFGLQGTPATPGAWLDGDHFLQTKDSKLWKTDARTGKSEPFADADLIKKSLAALKDVTASMADNISKGTTFRMKPTVPRSSQHRPRLRPWLLRWPAHGSHQNDRGRVRHLQSDGKRIAFARREPVRGRFQPEEKQ